ncbi:MAG: hypothetical protein K2N47_01960 [Clostridia bacterium]|nr:hypothetical protein [Clostridia bacterium]
MKKITKVLATVLAVAGVATFAGCKNTPDNRTAISANWNVKCDSAFEDAYFDDWSSKIEEATYKITFTEGTNTTYKIVLESLEVGEGDDKKTVVDEAKSYYKTTFTMEEYDWAASTIPEGFAPEEKGTEKVYVFTTTLKLTGKYVITATEEEFPFVNEVTTVSKFKTAANYLAPVYSKQDVNMLSPATLTAPGTKAADNANLNSIANKINSTFETYYSHDLAKVRVETTDLTKGNPQPEATTITLQNGDNYSVFDNSMLRFVSRGMSTGSNHSFYVFSPQNLNMQMTTTSVGVTAELNPSTAENADPIQTDIVNALNGAPKDYIFFDGAGETPSNPRYTAVTLSIKSDMEGQSLTHWYATVEDRSLNTTRSVLFAYTDPQPFGLGQINYHLKSLNWADKTV